MASVSIFLRGLVKAVSEAALTHEGSRTGFLAALWWPCRSPRNDYPSTWSGPEGSSHSGNIVCRGVAGGVHLQSRYLLISVSVSR